MVNSDLIKYFSLVNSDLFHWSIRTLPVVNSDLFHVSIRTLQLVNLDLFHWSVRTLLVVDSINLVKSRVIVLNSNKYLIYFSYLVSSFAACFDPKT